MNLDLTLAIIFYLLLILFFMRHKDKVQFQGKIIALYRTQFGIKLMEKIAKKFPRTLRFFGVTSIIVGFLGMGFIFYWLLKGTLDLLLKAGTPPAVAPILPGIKVIPGLPVLSFMHWIITILIIAVIHEFSHGVYARLHNIKVQSSGFALFGPILAAFVEPDEKQVSKKSKKIQLSIFSAGPFSNILTGFIFLLFMSYVTVPAFGATHDEAGIIVNALIEGQPMESTGIGLPFIINGINNHDVDTFAEFTNETNYLKPGDEITLNTDKGNYSITAGLNPDNNSRGFIGVSNFEISRIPDKDFVEKYGSFLPPFVEWLHMLFFWLWVVSWGVGLFNLLPLGPIDGGRMLLSALIGITKNEKKAKKYWSIVSLMCLLLIFINLAPYLWKLVLWILKPLIFIFTLF